MLSREGFAYEGVSARSVCDTFRMLLGCTVPAVKSVVSTVTAAEPAVITAEPTVPALQPAPERGAFTISVLHDGAEAAACKVTSRIKELLQADSRLLEWEFQNHLPKVPGDSCACMKTYIHTFIHNFFFVCTGIA